MRTRIFNLIVRAVIVGALLYVLYIPPAMTGSTEWEVARITLVAIVACVAGFSAGVLYERDT